MPAGVHYDGDYTLPTQVGGPVVEDLLLEQARLFRIKYHQLTAVFESERPTFNSIGAAGTAWAGLPVVEITPATDLGGGLSEFFLTYATTPLPHSDSELFAFQYQRIVAGNVQAIAIPVRSTVTYTYRYTVSPAGIPTAHFFRAEKIGNDIIFVGTPPGEGATQFLGEDETVERWKGNIFRKKSRTVPALTISTLA